LGNSYPGNLPKALEREKLAILAGKIEESFGAWPTIYKAGRYGIGPHSHEILEDLGFEIDISASPPMDFTSDGGPDFSRDRPMPYRFGRRRDLWCLPNTGGFVGYLARFGPPLHSWLDRPALRRARLPGIAARLGALERMRLSPEGFTLGEMKRLTRWLLARGHRIFVLSLHSPSLEPGHTPYVRNGADLEAFLDRLRCFLDFFRQELGGDFTTPHAVKAALEERFDP
jgi:hypothetical protein